MKGNIKRSIREFGRALIVEKREDLGIRYGTTIKDQKRIPLATPGEQVVNHILPSPNTELKVITYNFPKQEFEKDSPWVKWLKKQSDRGVEIKVIGGLQIEAEKEVKELVGGEIMKVKLLDSSLTRHVLIAQPRQLWVEEYHTDGNARDCTFTSNPDPVVWDQVNKWFDGLWAKAKPFPSV